MSNLQGLLPYLQMILMICPIFAWFVGQLGAFLEQESFAEKILNHTLQWIKCLRIEFWALFSKMVLWSVHSCLLDMFCIRIRIAHPFSPIMSWFCFTWDAYFCVTVKQIFVKQILTPTDYALVNPIWTRVLKLPIWTRGEGGKIALHP